MQLLFIFVISFNRNESILLFLVQTVGRQSVEQRQYRATRPRSATRKTPSSEIGMSSFKYPQLYFLHSKLALFVLLIFRIHAREGEHCEKWAYISGSWLERNFVRSKVQTREGKNYFLIENFALKTSVNMLEAYFRFEASTKIGGSRW